MAVVVAEIVGSRSNKTGLEDEPEERHYVAFGSDDPSAIDTALDAALSATIEGTDFTLLFQDFSKDHQGNGLWFVTARYSVRIPRGAIVGRPLLDDGPLLSPAYYNFELGVEQQKVFASKSRVFSMDIQTLAAAPNVAGAIGVNGNRVEGTQIDVPKFCWSEPHYFRPADITEAYKIGLENLCASPINDATFRGRDRGQVRFLGASGALRDAANFEINFHFASAPNLTRIKINDTTYGVNDGSVVKEAWDLLDIQFEDAVVDHVMVKVPRYIRVHRLYEKSSFDVLGIGV